MTVVEGILDEFDKIHHDTGLSPQWLAVLLNCFYTHAVTRLMRSR